MKKLQCFCNIKRVLQRSIAMICMACVIPTSLQAQIAQKSDDYSLNRNPNNYSIATPNAATFNKYMDSPVDLYSGTAQVNIPVYTLKDGSVELPISLSYATSGIKVNEEAGWVGLGWMLDVGGCITRKVIGEIDCYNPEPYYKNVMAAYEQTGKLSNTTHIKGPWSSDMRLAMDWFLTEPSMRKAHYEGRFNPDVFCYSCPDGKGRFVIDSRNDSIYLLDRREDVKIEMTTERSFSKGQVVDALGSRLKGFKLTFPNGVVHNFTLMSVMSTNFPVYMGVQSEFYALSQTVYPNGQKVDYSYDTTAVNWGFSYGENLKSVILSSSVRVDNNQACGDNRVARSHSSRSFIDCTGREVNLTRIKTDNYEVHFVSSLRDDLPEVKKLDRIYVKSLAAVQPTDTCCWDYRFSYDYFISEDSGNCWSKYASHLSVYRQKEHMLKRLKLNTVFATAGGQETEKYRFFYNAKTLPRKDSYAVDYWGYYNGQLNNISFIPDIYYLMWHDPIQYQKIQDLPRDNSEPLSKAMRAYDFESSKASILTGVQYPTGGYSEIVYEPHHFVDYFVPTLSQTRTDLPTESVVIYDNNSFDDHGSDLYSTPKNHFYSFKEDKVVTVTVSLFRGKNTWKSVAGHRAYLYYIENDKPVRKDLSLKEECEALHIKEEINHQSLPSTTVSKSYKLTVKKGTGYFVVDLPDELGDQTIGSGTDARISMLVKYDNKVEGKRESEGAGVRIKEVNFYDSPSKGTCLQQISYEYVDPETNTCSGLLLNKLQFVNYYPGTYDKLGQYFTTACNFQKVESIACRSDKLELSGSNFFSSPYQSSANVGYTYVKETKHKDGQEGHTWYKYHNEEPRMEEHSIPVYSPLNGSLLETAVYNAAKTLVQKTQFTYEAPVYRYYFGMNFYDRINLFPELFYQSGWQCMTMSDNSDGASYYLGCNNSLFYAQMAFWQDGFENTYVGSVNRLAMVVHPLNFYNIRLKEKRMWKDGVEIRETYNYNLQTQQLKEKQIGLSDGGTLKITYTYPNDCPWGIYTTMTQKHCISPIVEEKKFKNGRLMESILTEFLQVSEGLYLPSVQHYSEITTPLAASTVTFSSAGRNKTVYPADNIVYHHYDKYGHVLNLSVNNRESIYLWSYKGQYPVAEIDNISYDTVKAALGSVTPENLSSMPIPNMDLLRSLRTKLPAAHVRIYEYKSSAGVSRAMLPNGNTVGYEYDSLNRLVKMKDYNGKTTEEYGYHYKP